LEEHVTKAQYFKALYTPLRRVPYIVPYMSENLRVFCISILIPQLQNEKVAITQILLMGKVWHTVTVHLTSGHCPGHRSEEQSPSVKSSISATSTKSQNHRRAECWKGPSGDCLAQPTWFQLRLKKAVRHRSQYLSHLLNWCLQKGITPAKPCPLLPQSQVYLS